MIDEFKGKTSKIEILGEDGQPYSKDNPPHLVTMEFTPVEGFIFRLELLAKGNHPPKIKGQLDEMISFLRAHLVEFDIKKEGETSYRLSFTSSGGDEARDKIDKYLKTPPAVFAISDLLGMGDKFKQSLEEELRKKEEELRKKEEELRKKDAEIAVLKKGKFKRAGHLTDQMLKYPYPKDQSPQYDIFDNLLDGTKHDIKKAGVELTEVVEGIKLSSAENKVVDCLCKLLHERSQVVDPTKEDYYSGNVAPVVDPITNQKDVIVSNYGGEIVTASKLAVTLYELTKEYKGGEAVSGKDVDNVSRTLVELSDKKFLLKYKEETRLKNGTKRVREIEVFHPIIALPNYRDILYSKEGIELSKREETLIMLHPIFKRHIEGKFILLPNDITRRTKIANGSHKVPEITYRLREYLTKEHSLKHYEPEIYLDRLYWLVHDKWMRENRRALVKKYLDRAIDTVKTLGLLLDYKVEPGKTTGEPKIIFYLNKDWD